MKFGRILISLRRIEVLFHFNPNPAMPSGQEPRN